MKSLVFIACLAILGQFTFAQDNSTVTTTADNNNGTASANATTTAAADNSTVTSDNSNSTTVESSPAVNNTVDQSANNATETDVENPPTMTNDTSSNNATVPGVENNGGNSTTGGSNNVTMETTVNNNNTTGNVTTNLDDPNNNNGSNNSSSTTTNETVIDNNSNNNATTTINNSTMDNTNNNNTSNNNNNNTNSNEQQGEAARELHHANETDMTMLGVGANCSSIVQDCYHAEAAQDFADLHYCEAYTKTSVCVAENKTIGSTVMTCSHLERARLEVFSCSPATLGMSVGKPCEARLTQCAVGQLNITDLVTEPDQDMFKAKVCEVNDLEQCLMRVKYGAVCTKQEAADVIEAVACSAMTVWASSALLCVMLLLSKML